MKSNKVVKVAVYVYLVIYVVPPIIKGTIRVIKATFGIINEAEKIKEIKKDFELRRQGVITVDYQEVED